MGWQGVEWIHLPQTDSMWTHEYSNKPSGTMICWRFLEWLGNVLTFRIILWHVDPLPGNDLKISTYTTAAAKYWLCKQRPLLGNG
jgi:hypothetical protein